tara:strand:+ start:176 stop:421 length:246 start_codon:yes stop_codon:yes gene_type:complete
MISGLLTLAGLTDTSKKPRRFVKMSKRLIVLDDNETWTAASGNIVEVTEEAYELILDGYSPFSDEVTNAGLTIINKIGEEN